MEVVEDKSIRVADLHLSAAENRTSVSCKLLISKGTADRGTGERRKSRFFSRPAASERQGMGEKESRVGKQGTEEPG